MYWTLQLATELEDAPWPASKSELIDYAERYGLSPQVIENLKEMEEEEETYDSILDIWPEFEEWSSRIDEANDEKDY